MARVPVYEGDRVAPAAPMGARLRPVDNGGGAWGGVAQGLQSLAGGLNQMSDDAKVISDINGAKRLDIEASAQIDAIQGEVLGAKGEAASTAAAEADRRLTEAAAAILERARTDPERAAVSQSLDRRMALSRRLIGSHIEREVRAGAEQVAQDRAEQSARLAVAADDEEEYHTQLRTGLDEVGAAARRRGEDGAAVIARQRVYASNVDRQRIQRFVDSERLGAAEALLTEHGAEMVPAERAAAELALAAPRRSARVRAIADGAEARVAEAQVANDQGGGLAAMAPRERLAALLASLDDDRSLDPEERSAAKDELARRENDAVVVRRANERSAERAAWDFVEAQGEGGFTAYSMLPPQVREALTPEARDRFDALALINGRVRPPLQDGGAAWDLKALAHDDPQGFLDTDLRGWRGELTARSFDELSAMQEQIRANPNAPELARDRRIFEGIGRALGVAADAGAEEMAPRFDDGVYRLGESGGAMLRAEPFAVPAEGGAGLFQRTAAKAPGSVSRQPRIRMMPRPKPAYPRDWLGFIRNRAADLPFPPPPQPNDLDGKFASRLPRPHDVQIRGEAEALAKGARLHGYPNAGRMMDQFIWRFGTAYDPGVSKMIEGMPVFAREVEEGRERLKFWIAKTVHGNYAGKSANFHVGTDWSVHVGDSDGTKSEKDWYYAMNGFNYAFTASVKVVPDRDGGSIVTVVPTLYVFDRYNWDHVHAPVDYDFFGIIKGKRNYKDKDFRGLHESGLARNYEVRGAKEMDRFWFKLPPASAR